MRDRRSIDGDVGHLRHHRGAQLRYGLPVPQTSADLRAEPVVRDRYAAVHMVQQVHHLGRLGGPLVACRSSLEGFLDVVEDRLEVRLVVRTQYLHEPSSASGPAKVVQDRLGQGSIRRPELAQVRRRRIRILPMERARLGNLLRHVPRTNRRTDLEQRRRLEMVPVREIVERSAQELRAVELRWILDAQLLRDPIPIETRVHEVGPLRDAGRTQLVHVVRLAVHPAAEIPNPSAVPVLRELRVLLVPVHDVGDADGIRMDPGHVRLLERMLPERARDVVLVGILDEELPEPSLPEIPLEPAKPLPVELLGLERHRRASASAEQLRSGDQRLHALGLAPRELGQDVGDAARLRLESERRIPLLDQSRPLLVLCDLLGRGHGSILQRRRPILGAGHDGHLAEPTHDLSVASLERRDQVFNLPADQHPARSLLDGRAHRDVIAPPLRRSTHRSRVLPRLLDGILVRLEFGLRIDRGAATGIPNAPSFDIPTGAPNRRRRQRDEIGRTQAHRVPQRRELLVQPRAHGSHQAPNDVDLRMVLDEVGKRLLAYQVRWRVRRNSLPGRKGNGIPTGQERIDIP